MATATTAPDPMPEPSTGAMPQLGRRLAARRNDLLMVQRAAGSIVEFGDALNASLLNEERPSERLRMLRETTNRITRIANDAVQAYRRVNHAIAAEVERPTGDIELATAMRGRLQQARAEMLSALEDASHRYSWAKPWLGTTAAPPVPNNAPGTGTARPSGA